MLCTAQDSLPGGLSREGSVSMERRTPHSGAGILAGIRDNWVNGNGAAPASHPLHDAMEEEEALPDEEYEGGWGEPARGARAEREAGDYLSLCWHVPPWHNVCMRMQPLPVKNAGRGSGCVMSVCLRAFPAGCWLGPDCGVDACSPPSPFPPVHALAHPHPPSRRVRGVRL